MINIHLAVKNNFFSYEGRIIEGQKRQTTSRIKASFLIAFYAGTGAELRRMQNKGTHTNTEVGKHNEKYISTFKFIFVRTLKYFSKFQRVS